MLWSETCWSLFLLSYFSCVTLGNCSASAVSWEGNTCHTGLLGKTEEMTCPPIKLCARGRTNTYLTVAFKTMKLLMMLVKMSLAFFELQRDVRFFPLRLSAIKTFIILVYFARFCSY